MRKIASAIALIATTILGGLVGAAVGAIAALTFNGVGLLIPMGLSADVLVTAVILGSLFAIATCAATVPIAGDEFKKEAE